MKKTLEVIPVEKFRAEREVVRINDRIDELVARGKLDLAKKMTKTLYHSYGIDIGVDSGHEIIGWGKNY